MAQTAVREMLLHELEELPEEKTAEVLDFVRFIKSRMTEELKIEQALALYREGKGSIGYIAELVGIPKRELVREAKKRGIEPEFSEKTVKEELT
ncbi:MAG TPA: hypothetical protein ENG33_03590 [Chloroflexi bacterium]|nr:hypothetical protein [Chloroflexota bacterium]